jgi:NADH dehydrogenase
MHVAQAAATAGVQRLVHISGLGADPESDSPYARARGIGERLVTEAFPAATILRPSIIFALEGGFLNRLAALARVLPVLPLFGAGETKLQPVFVGDVAEAVAKALAAPAAMGRLYELGGPRVYTYKELMQLVLARTGRKRLLMPVPYVAWKALAASMAPLPSRPISRNQVELMQQDSVVRADALTLADLGIAPTPVEAMWPTYPGQHCSGSAN